MAPISPESDLLDHALKSKTVLPSWRSIFTRLTAPTPTPSHATITRISDFLLAPSSLATLANCHDPFPPPSAASKSDFEKRTAAINFTAADQPNGNGAALTGPGSLGALPGIAQLREEALELAAALGIDEVAALRIAVLEYQSRPSRGLAAANTAGGDGREDAGAETSQADLSPEARKEKVYFDRLVIYLSERKYVMKVATFLLRLSRVAKKRDVWGDVARRYAVEGIIEKGGNAAKTIESIGRRWREKKNTDLMPPWVKSRLNGPYADEMLFVWEKQTLLEGIHLLQFLFLHAYSPVEEISASLVMKWFGLMKETKFFTTTPVTSAPEVGNLYTYIQGLASLLSAAFLQMPKVEKYLQAEVAKSSTPDSSATTPSNSPPRAASAQSDQDFYIQNQAAILAITECLKDNHNYTIVCASLATMTWVMILDLLRLVVAMNNDYSDDEGGSSSRRIPAVVLYEATLPKLFVSTVEVGIRTLANGSATNMLKTVTLLLDPSESSAAAATGSGFWLGCEEDHFRMKNVLAYLIRKSQSYLEASPYLYAAAFLVSDVDYTEQLAFHKFMEQEEQIAKDEDFAADWTGSPAAKFWLDPESLGLIDRTKNRFPYEPLPFLNLMKGLASEGVLTMEYLTRMKTYTQRLPLGFREYDIDDEDSDVMMFRLATDLVLFSPREGGIFDHEGYGTDGAFFIPRGTLGIVTSTTGSQPVVAWQFEYNALTLFGRVLECALIGTGVDKGPTLGQLAASDTITEIVALLTKLISSATNATSKRSMNFDATEVLAEASDAVGRNRDVVSIIFDLLEEALQSAQQHRVSKAVLPIQFATTALHFVAALVPTLPGRVWPYLARSGLLERNGRGGALAGILGGVEAVQGDYSFTLSSLMLYEDLVDEAVKSSVANKGHSSSLTLASKSPAARATGTGVSDIVQKEILLDWTKASVDVFESYRGWKYLNMGQKMEIGTRISRIFTTILDYVYGIDEFSDMDQKITSVLAPSAEYLVSIFLPSGTNALALEPVMGAILDGVQTPESSLYLNSLAAWIGQVISVVNFADILVRVRFYLGLPPSQLEKQLFSISASIAKLYALNERYKQPALELLESLVNASASFTEEPLSLLGHLGAYCANHLVALLSNLDKPYDDTLLESRIWNFVSTVVSNKQQGMSILLLRGEALRGGAGSQATAVTVRKTSMLSIALDTVKNIDALEPERTLAILEFLSTATDFWSLAMVDLARHPTFLEALTRHAEKLQIEFLPADSKDIITQKAHTLAVAAHIAKLLALFLHSRGAAQRSDDSFLKHLLPRLNFYFEKAVKISGYRPSLHTHLQKNFEEKWRGLKLSQLKKTRLRRVEYGRNAVYDMNLAGKLLGFDPSWGARADGYANEVEQANLNLSLITTQVDLMDAWQILAIELCDHIKNDRTLADSLVRVVETCLQENIETGLPAPIFANILCSRAEFAFVIVNRLYKELPGDHHHDNNNSDVSGLLFDNVFKLTWKAITDTAAEFIHALQTADMDYYRSLLRILYIVLLAASTRPKIPLEKAEVVLDLINLVVAQGFKQLAHAAHSHPHRANPQDIALITAILQAALHIPGMEAAHPSLGAHLAHHDTIRAATTLFSWAEQLAAATAASSSSSPPPSSSSTRQSDDPVYAELSALFLVELSSIPILAEQLALENVLEHLLCASLSARIARGVSVQSEPRLHLIWTHGLLPLALNLLATLGARFGREIVTFLRFFAAQIRGAVAEWARPAVVTLPALAEVTAVAMLVAVVTRLGGGAELAQVGFDRAALAEGVDYLLSHRNYLKTLVAPVTAEQEEWCRAETQEGGNELVERVVAGMVLLQGLLGEDEPEE